MEIRSYCHPDEALCHMKFDGLMKLKSDEFEFREYGRGDYSTAAVVVGHLSEFKRISNEAGHSFRQMRPKAVVMVFVTDLDVSEVEQYKEIPDFVDVLLVPTPEMKNHLKSFTSCRVEVLIDPIDFNLSNFVTKPCDYDDASPQAIKLVWFGYPQSYSKSLSGYVETIRQLVDKGEIEYHIITRNETYGKGSFFTIHEYKTANFSNLLTNFDVCIVSHTPFDFSVNTYWKSENKAVLAINRGLPVVASRTPAYERLLLRCNLEEYLFSSSEELVTALRRLKSVAERKRYMNASQDIVLKEYSCQRMVDDWYQIYTSIKATKESS